MSYIVFSHKGLHFEDQKRKDVLALFMPSMDRIQKFSDIPSPTPSTVKDRVGVSESDPLFRVFGSMVYVYGYLPEALSERREKVGVYLPEDFLPEEADVFYFVFPPNWVFHGVKTITDDGRVEWGLSRLDVKEADPVQTVLSSISNRMFDGKDEQIHVAVHEDKKLQNDLQAALSDFSVKLNPFSSLSPRKGVEPLYMHKDYGLFMLTSIMFAVLLVFVALGYLLLNYIRLGEAEEEIAQLQKDISRIQRNDRVGHIKNPKQVLDYMERPVRQQPSSILNAAGEIGVAFGSVKEIELDLTDNESTQGDVLVVALKLASVRNGLLLDQERVAQVVTNEKPWVRSLARTGRGGAEDTMELKIGLQVK